MAKSHGRLAKVYASGRNLSPYLQEWRSAPMLDTVDVTAFETAAQVTSTDKEWMTGMRGATMTGSGLFAVGANAAAADEADEVLAAALDDPASIVSYWPAADALGAQGRGLVGTDNTYTIGTPIGGASTIQAAITGESFDIIRSLGPRLAVSGAGNGTGLDYGALQADGTAWPSVRGLSAYLQVLDKTGGAGTLTVKVQHSVDGSTWADLATFTGWTVGNVAERLTVAAGVNINRHLRALWTVSGGTFTIQVGVSRK